MNVENKQGLTFRNFKDKCLLLINDYKLISIKKDVAVLQLSNPGLHLTDKLEPITGQELAANSIDNICISCQCYRKTNILTYFADIPNGFCEPKVTPINSEAIICANIGIDSNQKD